MNRYRIVIADDHPMFLDALINNVKLTLPELFIESSGNYQQLFELLDDKEHDIDLVMMDLAMPDGEGINSIRYLRQRFPALPLLIITGKDDFVTKQQCLAAGASEFLSKCSDASMLQATIVNMLSGEHNYSSLEQVHKTPPSPSPMQCLTPSQLKVLQMLAQGSSNKRIALQLNIAEKTVKAHVSAILQRLQVKNRTQAALLVKLKS